MPKLTLLLGRKPMQVFDMDHTTIRIGRHAEMEIVIDNPSVSRAHAHLRKEGDRWVVADLGSANGTFLNGNKITSEQPLKAGDEIGIGKFSLLFEQAVRAPAAAQEAAPAAARPAPDQFQGTMHIKPHEVTALLKDSSAQRRAHLAWESGGQRGTHYLADAPALLIGTDELCDLQVPKGPKHHLLVMWSGKGCEVRNLETFGRMKVAGIVTRKARLKDGDVVEMGGLKLTFMGNLVGS